MSGFLNTLGSFTGLKGGVVPKPKDIEAREAYTPAAMKKFSGGASSLYGKYLDKNPYDKGQQDYLRTEAEGAISGEEKAALTESDENATKYGGQDANIRRKMAIRRAGMGARADARRRAIMEFLAARTGLDMQLMDAGHGMAMDASKQMIGDTFQRAEAKTQQYANRFGAVKDWAGMLGGGMVGKGG